MKILVKYFTLPDGQWKVVPQACCTLSETPVTVCHIIHFCMVISDSDLSDLEANKEKHVPQTTVFYTHTEGSSTLTCRLLEASAGSLLLVLYIAFFGYKSPAELQNSVLCKYVISVTGRPYRRALP